VPRLLVDVWTRGLYGHVGQWSDLATLTVTPERRPRQFVVDPAAPLNLDRVALVSDRDRKKRAGSARPTSEQFSSI
jgi:hypothetical protein